MFLFKVTDIRGMMPSGELQISFPLFVSPKIHLMTS